MKPAGARPGSELIINRALQVGADPNKIAFAGVGKTEEEFRYGLENDILLFNVESESELEALDRTAGSMKKKAKVAIRINPDVDPETHTYIATGKKESKFGIDIRVDVAGPILKLFGGLFPILPARAGKPVDEIIHFVGDQKETKE